VSRGYGEVIAAVEVVERQLRSCESVMLPEVSVSEVVASDHTTIMEASWCLFPHV
jgi:hypothetical protein